MTASKLPATGPRRDHVALERQEIAGLQTGLATSATSVLHATRTPTSQR